MGFSVDVWWGALSVEGRKLDRCSKVIIVQSSGSQEMWGADQFWNYALASKDLVQSG